MRTPLTGCSSAVTAYPTTLTVRSATAPVPAPELAPAGGGATAAAVGFDITGGADTGAALAAGTKTGLAPTATGAEAGPGLPQAASRESRTARAPTNASTQRGCIRGGAGASVAVDPAYCRRK